MEHFKDLSGIIIIDVVIIDRLTKTNIFRVLSVGLADD